MKRKFAPMPQTVREKPGQEFCVMWQLASICHGPEQKDRWSVVPIPRGLPELKILGTFATRLKKQEADKVIRYWQSRPGCEVFEFKIQPIAT